MQRVLVIHGAGFVGSGLVRHVLHHTGARVTVLQPSVGRSATASLRGLPSHRLRMLAEDLADEALLERRVAEHDVVVHVGESPGPLLLAAAARHRRRFHQAWINQSGTDRRRAGLVRGWARDGVHATATCTSELYGPWQEHDRLVPRTITAAAMGARLRLDGAGLRLSEWTHVDDHASAVLLAVRGGRLGALYPISASPRHTDVDVVRAALRLCGATGVEIDLAPRPATDISPQIVDASRIRSELFWRPRYADLDAGLAATTAWHHEQAPWRQRQAS